MIGWVGPKGTFMGARAIDLNCDMGEGAGNDAALVECVTSANIACGGHAGDEQSMRVVVREALQRGVAIGAHPGYPDRAGFGRVAIALSPREVELCVAEQVERLSAIARQEGTRVRHVKPHGALYHAAMNAREVAAAVAAGVRRVDAGLVLVGLAGARGLEWWREMGLRVAAEAFADRRYEGDGSLRGRGHADAMIEDPREAAEQASRIARGAGVVAVDGREVGVSAATICIHGDSAGAVALARAVRTRLDREGVQVRPLA